MIPVLYENDTSISDIMTRAHNGLGPMSETVSALVTEERNGEFELEMKYPVAGRRFADLTEKPERIILATPAKNEPPEPFRIYRVTKPMNGNVTIYARHLTYDLLNIVTTPFKATSASEALTGLKSNAVGDCPFEFETDIDSSVGFTRREPIAIRTALGGIEGSVLDVYGGEYKWTGNTVKLLKERGADRGVTVRYGINLTDIKQDENIENVYTSVIAYWKDPESDDTVVSARFEHENADNFPTNRTKLIDLSAEYVQNKPTQQMLNEYAQTYATKVLTCVPRVNIKVSFADLSKDAEYKDIAAFSDVNLCDTVTVVFPKLAVNAKAKVVRTVWDVLKDEYKSVEIGDIKTGLADSMVAQQTALNQLAIDAEAYAAQADAWTYSIIIEKDEWVVSESEIYGDNTYYVRILLDDRWVTPTADQPRLIGMPQRFLKDEYISTGVRPFLKENVRITITAVPYSGVLDEEIANNTTTYFANPYTDGGVPTLIIHMTRYKESVENGVELAEPPRRTRLTFNFTTMQGRAVGGIGTNLYTYRQINIINNFPIARPIGYGESGAVTPTFVANAVRTGTNIGLRTSATGTLPDTTVFAIEDASGKRYKATLAQLRDGIDSSVGLYVRTYERSLFAEGEATWRLNYRTWQNPAGNAVFYEIDGYGTARIANGGTSAGGDIYNSDLFTITMNTEYLPLSINAPMVMLFPVGYSNLDSTLIITGSFYDANTKKLSFKITSLSGPLPQRVNVSVRVVGKEGT